MKLDCKVADAPGPSVNGKLMNERQVTPCGSQCPY